MANPTLALPALPALPRLTRPEIHRATAGIDEAVKRAEAAPDYAHFWYELTGRHWGKTFGEWCAEQQVQRTI